MDTEALRRRRTNSRDMKEIADFGSRMTVSTVMLKKLILFTGAIVTIVILAIMVTQPSHPLNRIIIQHLEVPMRAFDILEKKHAVVVDAGSTGSRVLAYSFYKSMYDGELVLYDELWHQIKPGLSSFADNPTAGGDTISTLLDKAKERIPKHFWKDTPIALKATAGLRLLPEEKAEMLLLTADKVLRRSGFLISGTPLVEIMPDVNEGIFGWLTVNFLLKTFSEPVHSVVALDLGGGSTQITFIPSEQKTYLESPDGSIRTYDFITTHTLYTRSYLGLGLMSARVAIIEQSRRWDGIFSFCFTKQMEWKHQGVDFLIHAEILPGFIPCKEIVDRVLKAQNIHSPQELANRKIVAFSYFFDKAVEIGIVDSSGGEVTLDQYKQAAIKFCSTPSGFECLDLTFIYSYLQAYGLSDNTVIRVYKKIEGHETTWALGAALDLIAKQ